MAVLEHAHLALGVGIDRSDKKKNETGERTGENMGRYE